jgi:fructose-bisphosphate aldolase class I
MDIKKLQQVAKQLVTLSKGILAADESLSTIEKRFILAGIENIEENRKIYREMLFTTIGIEEYISGVILFEETLYQKTKEGVLFPEFLAGRDIVSGIKVDEGLEDFNGSEIEKITKGIETLQDRLIDYVKTGACFTKWRAVFNIEDNTLPTDACIIANAKLLAEYALYSQEAGLVPIVEPEVLMDGDHTIEKCAQITEKVLKEVFLQLKEKKIYFPGMILKPNMVIAGKDCINQSDSQEAAKKTLEVLKKYVPDEVAGIVFLSGGQTDVQATENLNQIVRLAKDKGIYPWPLTFSFGRALQDKAMKIWAGKDENILLAKTEFYKMAKANNLAVQGKL